MLSRLRSAQALAKLARTYATEAGAVEAKKGGGGFKLLLALTGAAGGLYYAKEKGLLDGVTGVPAPLKQQEDFKPDYDAVRAAISDLLDSNPDYDDGSYGPILVRLAWHTSGTYDKNTGRGGSNGATMRFAPESNWGANAGLSIARDLLEPVKAKFPWISYSDLWTLGGAVAVEEMGGPAIPWRPGRTDVPDVVTDAALPNGLLPDGDKDNKHVRDIFYRMGFDDQEIVALCGAHALGRCHKDRSGFDGPWTNAPTTFSNLYFTELKENKWHKRKWDGPLQYEDRSKQLMMLNTDMWLLWDKKFRKYVDLYAKDQDKFFEDFAKAFSKLLELGVPYEQTEAALAGSPPPALPPGTKPQGPVA
ncbi:hypothetical protein N2152v2_007333 [Parachlorella kessleri]